jgi:chromosomal replication initiation ATPase DnaA
MNVTPAPTQINYNLSTLLDDYLYVVWHHTNVMDKSICNYDFSKFRQYIKSKSRKRELVEIRQIFCYFCFLQYGYTLKAIGKILGHRDHSTVIHARDNVKNLLTTDKAFKSKYITLLNKFTNEQTK